MYYTCCINDRGMTGVKVKPKIVIVTLFFWYLGHTLPQFSDRRSSKYRFPTKIPTNQRAGIELELRRPEFI